MSGPRFTDCSLTDGDAAVWGGRLSTPMAARLAALLDRAGLGALEVASPEIIAACVARAEDPWRRIEDIAGLCPATPLRARIGPLTAHGTGGADVLGDRDMHDWIKRLAGAGIAHCLCEDPLDDPDRLGLMLRAAGDAGMRPMAVLAFRPWEDDAAHAARAHALVRAGAQALQLRDVAGVMTADRLAPLLAALAGAKVPLHLHLRATTGLAPMLAFQAMQAGIPGIDTALPALANGPSLPSAVNLLRGSDAVGVMLDGPWAEPLGRASAWLDEAAAREGWDVSAPWGFDLAPHIHGLEGGAVAEARARLGTRGEMLEFAHEAARVAREAGGLPPVAPFAAAIARQALWHVTGMARWERVHPLLARAIRGAFGPLPAPPDAALAQRLGVIGPDTAPPAPLEGGLQNRIGGAPVPAHPAAGYAETTPQEALALGLLAHMRRGDGFSEISVAGPDLTISLGGGGHA